MPHPIRLVLVHGINQQGKDPQQLKQAWIRDLESEPVKLSRRGSRGRSLVQRGS